MNSESVAYTIYIHVPYCLSKCPYCDFYSLATTSFDEQRYVQAVLNDLEFWRMKRLPKERPLFLKSIFFGGGTPSLLSPEAVLTILEGVRGTQEADHQIETSMEVNPGTVNLRSLQGYRQAGVNRISIGVQSFSDPMLKVLGRIHDSAQASAAIEVARKAGFENLGIDLIFGLPDQNWDKLYEDLTQAMDHGPEHLSLYGLTIEEGTPFWDRYTDGQPPLPSPDEFVEMMLKARTMLETGGLCAYEVSNFAREGYRCLHNEHYWMRGPSIGLGPGASSYWPDNSGLTGRRFFACKDSGYLEQPQGMARSFEMTEKVNAPKALMEILMLGLRRKEGISLVEMRHCFGDEFVKKFANVTESMVKDGLLEHSSGCTLVTRKGLPILDAIVEEMAWLLDERG